MKNLNQNIENHYFKEKLFKGIGYGLENQSINMEKSKRPTITVSLLNPWHILHQDLDEQLATGFDSNAIGLIVQIGRGNKKQYGVFEICIHNYSNNFSDDLEINPEHGVN